MNVLLLGWWVAHAAACKILVVGSSSVFVSRMVLGSGRKLTTAEVLCKQLSDLWLPACCCSGCRWWTSPTR
jgi:hypothetical protein